MVVICALSCVDLSYSHIVRYCDEYTPGFKGESLFPQQCADYRDDYIECLHHPKEAQRRRAIAEQVKRKEKIDKAAADDFVAASASATEGATKPTS